MVSFKKNNTHSTPSTSSLSKSFTYINQNVTRTYNNMSYTYKSVTLKHEKEIVKQPTLHLLKYGYCTVSQCNLDLVKVQIL